VSFLNEPGNLAETPLAAVLIEALNLRASGVLEVGHGGGTSRLWFRDGHPVGAQVFAGFKPLGMMLLQAGLIDIEALSRSLALLAESRRPQGAILVEMGAVSAEEVGRMLEQQQAGYFALIAALDEGPFVFDASTPVPEWTRTSRLSPVRTIVDALERPQANALVASALQPAAGGAVRLASGYPEIAGSFRWTDAERALVARLDRPISLEAFFSGAPVPPERARAVLAGLLLLGVADPAAAGKEGSEEQPPLVAIGGEEVTASFPVAGAAARAPARRSDPAEARARRQRLLQQAMRNMGVGPFASRGAPPEAGEAPCSGAPRAAPATAPAAPATAAEAQLRDALLAVAPRAREADLFVRLGVAATAGREDVKRAFLALARQFHPDRVASPALADLHDTVKDFFAAVNEAYEVLSDDRKRAAYLANRKGPGKAQVEAARVDFLKGEACLRTRDFARARGFYEAALRSDPRSEYRAALAWAYVADPACKDRERARALLDEATKDAACDRALYVAGIVARDDKDEDTAERLFRAALKANPRNADATRELRRLEARRAGRRDA
jgi:tetratricopeptide (TPR) repeat protein